jgi:hypothetical protein
MRRASRGRRTSVIARFASRSIVMHAALFAFALILIPAALIALAASSQERGATPPKPSAEQAKLESFAGVWDAEVEVAGQTSKGVETCKLQPGGFWLITDFEGSLMGAPFFGHGLTGFDSAKRKIVHVWAGSMGSPWMLCEGNFSADGNELVTESSGLDRQGKPARFRQVTTLEGRDHRTFEIFQLNGDQAASTMRIRYRRRS